MKRQKTALPEKPKTTLRQWLKRIDKNIDSFTKHQELLDGMIEDKARQLIKKTKEEHLPKEVVEKLSSEKKELSGTLKQLRAIRRRIMQTEQLKGKISQEKYRVTINTLTKEESKTISKFSKQVEKFWKF